jgi:hypothetical protein
MCKNSCKVKTIKFNKGTFLSHNTAAVTKYVNLPGLDQAAPEVVQNIPDLLVVPTRTDSNSSFALLIKYSGKNCETLNESTWHESVTKTVQVEGTATPMTVFNLNVRECTDYKSKKGIAYFLKVEYRARLYTIPNTDPLTNMLGPYIIVKTPKPTITDEHVTHFSVNGKKIDVQSYTYNVASGNCKIKYCTEKKIKK